MEREPENAEDIDRLLSAARKGLQEFEDGADWRRLMERVRTASPAHPVLLTRVVFATGSLLSFAASVAVLAVPMFSPEVARTLAALDEIIPFFPDEVPALPALLFGLSLLLGVGWMFATYAAMSLGRDTTMLPWEQKQHQKLVNEVTRLTTQKAVMERIRATPAGARPRIATPVPVANRSRQPVSAPGTSTLSRRATPSAPPRVDDTPAYVVNAPEARAGRTTPGSAPSLSPASTSTPAGAFGARPLSSRAPVAAPLPPPSDRTGSDRMGASAVPVAPEGRGGGLGAAGAIAAGAVGATAARSSGGLLSRAKSQPPSTGLGRNVAPAPPAEAEPEFDETEEAGEGFLGYTPPVTATTSVRTIKAPAAEPDEGGMRLGGVRLGATKAAEPAPRVDDFSDLVEVSPEPPPPREPQPRTATPLDTARNDGILSRARAGATNNRSTPFGAAGRIRPPPSSITGRPRAAPTTPPENEPATRSGSPLGAAPRTGVSVRNTRPPDPTADPSVRSNLPGGMFGTPPPISRQTSPPVAISGRAGDGAAARSRLPPSKSSEDEVTVMEEEEGDGDVVTELAARTPDAARSRPPSSAPPLQRPFPRFGPIPEVWLSEAIEKAERLQRAFPIQAHLEFSQEPHLPFTLVIARATPAMAVRAMVNFVEFLAQISTPPRARIELVNIPHLDRSFHKNVEAALEPYFQGNVEVEPNPGRVDILFTEPDPQWGEWSTLPVLDSAS